MKIKLLLGRSTYIGCLLVLLIACAKTQKPKVVANGKMYSDSILPENNSIPIGQIDSIASGLTFKPENHYPTTMANIDQLRTELHQKYISVGTVEKKQQVLEEAERLFTKTLLNKIIPYWYGTEWDFNGHTNTPQQGEIACGYFVSTTLKHMGLNINRYRLAQQTATNEARSLAVAVNDVRIVNRSTLEQNWKTYPKGLYFVGLDNHVGYLYLHKDRAYFIHSNYVDDRVMIEYAEHSPAFNSNVYHLVNLTLNKKLITKWIMNEKVKVWLD